jgi:hypothetical protein
MDCLPQDAPLTCGVALRGCSASGTWSTTRRAKRPQKAAISPQQDRYNTLITRNFSKFINIR